MSTKTFTGGAKLQAYLKEIATKADRSAVVKVGFPNSADGGGATYPGGQTVAMVAALQEYGAPRASIPPRPFFRTMIKKNKGHWGTDVGAALKHHDYDAVAALTDIGVEIEDELRDSITEMNAPPLSPITLMLRKIFGNHPDEIRGADVGDAAARVERGESYAGVSTKPLVWTGHMQNSIKSIVVKK